MEDLESLFDRCLYVYYTPHCCHSNMKTKRWYLEIRLPTHQINATNKLFKPKSAVIWYGIIQRHYSLSSFIFLKKVQFLSFSEFGFSLFCCHKNQHTSVRNADLFNFSSYDLINTFISSPNCDSLISHTFIYLGIFLGLIINNSKASK